MSGSARTTRVAGAAASVASIFTVAVVVVLLAVVGISSANAQTLTIIYVDAGAGPGGDGTSWNTAYTDLQDALTRADTELTNGADSVEIRVAEGQYFAHESDRAVSFHLRNNVALYGGFPTGGGEMADRDWRQFESILDGNIDHGQTIFQNTFNIVVGQDVDSTAVLDGFAIRNGWAGVDIFDPGNPPPGSGIRLVNATPTLRNIAVTDNEATQGGGGIHIQGGDVTITNLILAGNVGGDHGGGIRVNGADVTLVNAQISRNHATTAGLQPAARRGGAAYLLNGANLTLVNSLVTANSASSFLGGSGVPGIAGSTGQFTFPPLSNEKVTLRNSIVWGNGGTTSTNIWFTNVDIANSIYQGECDATLWEHTCGEGILNADPMLLHPPGTPNNSFIVGDARLLPGSPAIDAGSISAFTDVAGSLDHDLNGEDRFIGDAIDLGPFEAQFFDLGLDLTAPAEATAGSNALVEVGLTGENLDPPILDAATVTLTGHNGPTSINLNNSGEGSHTVTTTSSGPMNLTATLGSLEAQATIDWVAGAPHSLTVNASPSDASVGDPVTISVSDVQDAFGNPIEDDVTITFEALREGTPSATASVVNGSGSDPWTVDLESGTAELQYTNTLVGTDTISVNIDGATPGTVTTDTVDWTPGDPHEIVIDVEPQQQRVRNPVSVTARVTDQYGNNVVDETVVTFSVSRASWASLVVGDSWSVETDDGIAMIQYTNTQVGTDHITAVAGDANTTLSNAVRWMSSPDIGGPDPGEDDEEAIVEPDDPEGPTIRNVPQHIVLDPLTPAGAILDYDLPTSIDTDGSPLDVVCEPPPGSWVPIGHSTVHCSATNSNDVTTNASFGVTVRSFTGTDFSHTDQIDNPWFWATWARTDLPVRDLHVSRTWMWGPGPFTGSLFELYTTELQNPGGDPVFLNIPETEREVIYFDKARMEINDPDADPDDLWYVTNGLLVIELITGNRQFGDDLFIAYEPSYSNVAGDADDLHGPTYASLQHVLDAPAQDVGTLLTEQIDRDGTVTSSESWGEYNVTVGYVDDVTSHSIAGPFWEFMNSEGMVYEDGDLFGDALFENPFYATGRPVTEAYWANVKVAGEQRDVLIQCFERRCLTYTPGNSEGFVVEAGNVGQHYYHWRYVQAVD